VAEILANLLENAFRYSPQGSPVGLHCSGGSPADEPLVLTVWDGGAAIDATERQAIFERGVRGSRGLPLPGTGLGLALARDLARSLGGDLELLIPPRLVAAGLPAEGNAFRLRLPARPGGPAVELSPDSPPAVPRPWH
jgi:signal transduction histidine kinase